MKSSLLKSYVVSESKTYGLYCVERNHLRKYQKFVEIGDFASFNAAKSYLERNRKSLSKKIKTASINYSEPVFTKKEIKQRIRYGNNFNYNKQNGPVIVTKEAKKTSIADLAKEYETTTEFVMGFVDGINDSLKKSYDLETIDENTELVLDVDLEKLYFNMLDAKAEYLYTLPQWDGIFSPEKRKEIADEYKKSKTVVNSSEFINFILL